MPFRASAKDRPDAWTLTLRQHPLAGAGIGGQVIGASDRIGAFPQSRPVRPPDLAATIFHLLGLDPASEFVDPLGRPRRLTDNGEVLREIVGA